MSLARRLFGIFGILLAVFAGGCGLLFTASGLMGLSAGRNDYGVSVIAPVMGGVPAVIGALIGWWAWRTPKGKGEGASGDGQ